MRYLLPKDISERVGVSRSTVMRAIRSGDLPAIVIRAGKRKNLFRVSEDALEKWLRRNIYRV